MKYKNYKNPLTDDNRIYSVDEISKMPLSEVLNKKTEILSQFKKIGVPKSLELQNSENVVFVHEYTRDDGTVVKSHWRSRPEGSVSNAIDDEVKNDNQTDDNQGNITGAASQIDRKKESSEIKNLPKNNDDFFIKERNNPQSVLMRVNGKRNYDRPDAKLFMDIALVGPKNVPSTQDYQFISSENNKELNKKYNLTGNKEIPRHYDGFEFSEESPTAKTLNSSEEFKNQILDSKNYDSIKGTFKSDKLEIEFKNDTNLQYSFGHMTVLNPKIENGYITGTGYDKYDYSILYKGFYKGDIKTTFLNDAAKVLQMTDKLHNYYIFVPVKIKI